MPAVQMFEKRLDDEERLAALTEAVNRLPAGAAVRRLTPATLRPDAAAEAAQPDGRRASAPGTGAVVVDLGASTRTDADTSVRIGAGAGPDPDTVPADTGAAPTAAPNAASDPNADPDAIPVLEPLAGLLPGGLRRGEVAVLATQSRGPDYLALALLAGALNAGLWCAVVGVPELGVAALSEMLGSAPAGSPRGAAAPPAAAALDRLLLIPDPGEQWAEVLATLADGVDLLLARPATAVRTEVTRRVDTRLRQGRSPGTMHSAALIVLGAGWPSARLVLRTAHTDWTGLDGVGPTAGTGHLTGGRATVVAQGRATAGRPRTARIWLPDENGSVRALSDDPRTRIRIAAPDPGAAPAVTLPVFPTSA